MDIHAGKVPQERERSCVPTVSQTQQLLCLEKVVKLGVLGQDVHNVAGSFKGGAVSAQVRYGQEQACSPSANNRTRSAGTAQSQEQRLTFAGMHTVHCALHIVPFLSKPLCRQCPD